MNKIVKTKARYFVTGTNKKGNPEDFWIDDIDSYSNLSAALKDFMEKNASNEFNGRGVLLKEIGYRIVSNARNLSVKVIPVGDVRNNQPYYLIDRFTGTYTTYGGDFDGDCHKTIKYEKWEDLTKDLLADQRTRIIAKGLEVKVG